MSKKIIVFGASSTVGVHLIQQALDQGHKVTAFTRDKNKLATFSSALKIVEGNVFDQPQVEAAIKGHDQVYCALGGGRKGNTRSAGTKTIIDAMHNTEVQRLICQTTLGAGDSQANLNFFWKNIMFGWFIKEAFLDHELQEQYIFDSQLDWTIVRPAAFTNGSMTRKYRHGFAADDKTTQLKIARQDVAAFMLDQTDNDQYLHQTPGLSY